MQKGKSWEDMGLQEMIEQAYSEYTDGNLLLASVEGW